MNDKKQAVAADGGAWVPFPLPRQTNRAWREQALTRVAELRTLLEWFKSRSDSETPADAEENLHLDAAIEGHLTAAAKAAEGNSHWWTPRNGAVIERAMSNLDAAEAGLLRRAPAKYICGQSSHLWSYVRMHLPKDDPQRIRVGKVAEAAQRGNLDSYGKETIIRGVRAASLEARSEFTRVRSFRNVTLVSAAILTIAAIATVVWAWNRPGDLSLCFEPQNRPVACPIGESAQRGDVALVQFVGLLAAAVTGAASLRNVSGTSTRLGLPVALAVIKLPSGALTAFLGLILMRGNFIPGLSALDTSAQILAWAVVFGAAQQLLTGLVDRQADAVLNQVGGKANGAT